MVASNYPKALFIGWLAENKKLSIGDRISSFKCSVYVERFDCLGLGGAKELKGKGLRVIAYKLACWATIYHIWLRRNVIVHEDKVWTEEQLKGSIIKDVKARVGVSNKVRKVNLKCFHSL